MLQYYEYGYQVESNVGIESRVIHGHDIRQTSTKHKHCTILAMTKGKAAAKQWGKVAIKPAKPKGNNKSCGAPPKKTGNSWKWVASGSDDDPSSDDEPQEPHVRSRKRAKKATEIEEVEEVEAGVEEVSDQGDNEGGNETGNETEADKVTSQWCK